MEEVNLGVLGSFPLEDVICDSDFDSDDEFFDFIKHILQLFNDNIELIDRRLLFRMYDVLSSCRFAFWEKDGFNKIIDDSKLPENFQNMPNEEQAQA